MKCIKLKNFILFLIFVIILCTVLLYFMIICIKAKINTAKSSNMQKYMFGFNELSDYEDFKQHVINEYSSKKVIALTFDDGPSKYTTDLIKILKEHNAKATFFILGSCVQGNEQIITNTFLQGNEIATHGHSHKIMTKLSKDMLITDISNSLKEIEPAITEKISLIRPPYGITNDKVKNIANDFNLTIVKWSLDSLDWKLRNTEKITNRVLKQVKDGDIILMHDIYKSSIEATENIIKSLKNEYEFITVSEMLILKEFKTGYN